MPFRDPITGALTESIFPEWVMDVWREERREARMKKPKAIARQIVRTYQPKAQPIGKLQKTELVRKQKTHRKP